MKIKVLGLLMLVLLILTAGCADKQTEIKKPGTLTDKAKITQDLMSQIQDTHSLIAVQNQFISMKKGSSIDSYVLIKNAYPESKSFYFEECENCMSDFPEKTDIAADQHSLVKFSISAKNNAGTYNEGIIVKDSLNNAYAFINLIITVE